MTNLTEYRWYYCKMKNGDIRMLERGADYFLSGDVPLLNNEVESVLGEVPSYEEWQQLKEYERTVTSYSMKPIDYDIACETVNKLLDKKKELRQENTKLKELLKECVELMGDGTTYMHIDVYQQRKKDVLNAINQALGEE